MTLLCFICYKSSHACEWSEGGKIAIMKNFLAASIGRKFLMSATGIFMMMFVAVHLTINLLLIFDDSGELYNRAAYFMSSSFIVKIIEPILGFGFLIHILWSFFLEYQNWRARPLSYSKKNFSGTSSWASRNMLIIGSLVLVFLVIHVINFFRVINFHPGSMDTVIIRGREMEDTYSLVTGLFKESIFYDIMYILGGTLLGLHLSHGFWSAFHTLGLSNKHWLGRLKLLAKIYAVIVAIGFSIIPLYFLVKF